ncbi:hypothetical protein DRJ16_02010 [Candidatus Woesearchaeota archaeon]|nr:MAG: hypothetical protein DRJ16_02010 [Candidatus Woesearchaeota archaeon]
MSELGPFGLRGKPSLLENLIEESINNKNWLYVPNLQLYFLCKYFDKANGYLKGIIAVGVADKNGIKHCYRRAVIHMGVISGVREASEEEVKAYVEAGPVNRYVGKRLIVKTEDGRVEGKCVYADHAQLGIKTAEGELVITPTQKINQYIFKAE